MFSPAAAEYLQQLQQDYLTHLESEHDVTTFIDYFEHVDVFDRSEDPDELLSLLDSQQYPLESLFQVAPAHGQEVVLVSSNPGMGRQISPSHFDGSRHYGRHVRAGKDLEESARQLALNLNGYLTRAQGFSKIVPMMQDHLSILTSTDQSSFDEYIQFEESNTTPTIFDEIYFTRVYKYPSPDEDFLTDADLEFGRETFQDEIHTVADPSVIVATGAVAWRALYHSVDDPEQEIASYNNSHITGSFKKHDQGGARGGLYKFEENNLWVITTRHGSYSPDTNRLKSNLSHLNELT